MRHVYMVFESNKVIKMKIKKNEKKWNAFSFIHVLPSKFLFKFDEFDIDLKRNL